MLAEFKTLPQLLDHFKDQKTCLDYWEQLRWNGNPICPHCNHDKVYRTARGFKCAGKECGKKFSALVGSVFENTKLPLRVWFAAIFLFTAHKKGISSLQLSRDLGIGAKAAWYMLHRIRATMQEVQQEPLSGTIEVDETFVGGKNKNRHWDKKVKNSQGRTFKDKTPVLGMLQRGGIVRCFVIPDTKTSTIQPILTSHVSFGSVLCSDEWNAYRGLGALYDHHVVDHGRGQYTSGDATTNSIEGFWSHLKRGIFGIYHSVSRKHLQRYSDEFSFRYNYRHMSSTERFELAVQRSRSVSLLYKALTG